MNLSCFISGFYRAKHWFLPLLCVVAGCAGNVLADAPAAVTTNTVSAVTILRDLSYPSVRVAHLLAFISRVDDRPWYADDALLLLEMPRGKWMLVHAVRTPNYPPRFNVGSNHWMIYDVTDAPFVGDRQFDHRPTRQETDLFLKENRWSFVSDNGWRVVRRVVNENVWQNVLGYPSPPASAPALSGKP